MAADQVFGASGRAAARMGRGQSVEREVCDPPGLADHGSIRGARAPSARASGFDRNHI